MNGAETSLFLLLFFSGNRHSGGSSGTMSGRDFMHPGWVIYPHVFIWFRSYCRALSRPNKHAKTIYKTQCEISLCSHPKQTHKQSYLSPVQWSTTEERLFTECFKLLLLMSDSTVADTYLCVGDLPPPLFFFFFFVQSLLAFNSALDVRWILKIWAFRSKGKCSPDGKKDF